MRKGDRLASCTCVRTPCDFTVAPQCSVAEHPLRKGEVCSQRTCVLLGPCTPRTPACPRLCRRTAGLQLVLILVSHLVPLPAQHQTSHGTRRVGTSHLTRPSLRTSTRLYVSPTSPRRTLGSISAWPPTRWAASGTRSR